MTAAPRTFAEIRAERDLARRHGFTPCRMAASGGRRAYVQPGARVWRDGDAWVGAAIDMGGHYAHRSRFHDLADACAHAAVSAAAIAAPAYRAAAFNGR